MATAILRLWPEAQFAYGPPVENGFYYDIDMGDHTLSPDDLIGIEAKMADLAKRDVPYVREVKEWGEAAEYFRKKGYERSLTSRGSIAGAVVLPVVGQPKVKIPVELVRGSRRPTGPWGRFAEAAAGCSSIRQTG